MEGKRPNASSSVASQPLSQMKQFLPTHSRNPPQNYYYCNGLDTAQSQIYSLLPQQEVIGISLFNSGRIKRSQISSGNIKQNEFTQQKKDLLSVKNVGIMHGQKLSAEGQRLKKLVCHSESAQFAKEQQSQKSSHCEFTNILDDKIKQIFTESIQHTPQRNPPIHKNSCEPLLQQQKVWREGVIFTEDPIQIERTDDVTNNKNNKFGNSSQPFDGNLISSRRQRLQSSMSAAALSQNRRQIKQIQFKMSETSKSNFMGDQSKQWQQQQQYLQQQSQRKLFILEGKNLPFRQQYTLGNSSLNLTSNEKESQDQHETTLPQQQNHIQKQISHRTIFSNLKPDVQMVNEANSTSLLSINSQQRISANSSTLLPRESPNLRKRTKQMTQREMATLPATAQQDNIFIDEDSFKSLKKHNQSQSFREANPIFQNLVLNYTSPLVESPAKKSLKGISAQTHLHIALRQKIWRKYQDEEDITNSVPSHSIRDSQVYQLAGKILAKRGKNKGEKG